MLPPRSASQKAEALARLALGPRLPWEIIEMICELADQATLVRLCRVSFGVLEIAGPLLYRNVSITSTRAFVSFFLYGIFSLVSSAPSLLLRVRRLS